MSPAGQAGRPPRPASGGRVPPARRIQPRCPAPEAESRRGGWSMSVARARTMSPAGLAGRTHRSLARRLSPAGPADPTTLPRSRTLSPAVRTGLNPRPGPLGGVQPGRMVVPRVPGQEDQSAWQAGRHPRPAPGISVPLGRLVEYRARRLVPPGRLDELRGPRSDDESRRAGWSTPAARARTLSPAGQACGAPCWEASPAWAPGGTPWPALGR